jgi:hypothetical protein
MGAGMGAGAGVGARDGASRAKGFTSTAIFAPSSALGSVIAVL